MISMAGEAGWFPVNWDILNLAWAGWLGFEDESDGGDHLAEFLDCIPVEYYGFTRDELPNFPEMELCRYLFDDFLPGARLLADVELYDIDWRAADRAAAWERLREIEADPDPYPEPVRRLPELVRWACGRTGNIILDRAYDPPDDYRFPSWSELEQVKGAWFWARPVIDQHRRLAKWIEADKSRLALLAYALMEGDCYDELEW